MGKNVVGINLITIFKGIKLRAMKTLFKLEPDQVLANKWWEKLSENKRKQLALRYYQKDSMYLMVHEVHNIWEKELLNTRTHNPLKFKSFV